MGVPNDLWKHTKVNKSFNVMMSYSSVIYEYHYLPPTVAVMFTHYHIVDTQPHTLCVLQLMKTFEVKMFCTAVFNAQQYLF